MDQNQQKEEQRGDGVPTFFPSKIPSKHEKKVVLEEVFEEKRCFLKHLQTIQKPRETIFSGKQKGSGQLFDIPSTSVSLEILLSIFCMNCYLLRGDFAGEKCWDPLLDAGCLPLVPLFKYGSYEQLLDKQTGAPLALPQNRGIPCLCSCTAKARNAILPIQVKGY